MAQPEAGAGAGAINDEMLRLNRFPRPASAMQMAERMMSFFIVFQTYMQPGNPWSRVAQVRHGRPTSDGAVTVP